MEGTANVVFYCLLWVCTHKKNIVRWSLQVLDVLLRGI
jgi:hypothetical protein